MDASNLRIKRVIVEVRYSGILGYSRLREALFDKWAEDFTKVLVNDSSVILLNDDLNFKIFSEWHRSGTYFENVDDPNFYIKKTNEYLGKLLEHYNRSRLSRIGNRFAFVLPFEGSFDSLFKTLKTNIYKEKVDQLGQIVDLGMIALTAKESDCKINISLGPMRKQEITTKNEFQYDGDPDVAFFLDIDYYSDIKKEYDLGTFVQNAWKFVDRASKRFIQNISEGD